MSAGRKMFITFCCLSIVACFMIIGVFAFSSQSFSIGNRITFTIGGSGGGGGGGDDPSTSGNIAFDISIDAMYAQNEFFTADEDIDLNGSDEGFTKTYSFTPSSTSSSDDLPDIAFDSLAEQPANATPRNIVFTITITNTGASYQNCNPFKVGFKVTQNDADGKTNTNADNIQITYSPEAGSTYGTIANGSISGDPTPLSTKTANDVNVMTILVTFHILDVNVTSELNHLFDFVFEPTEPETETYSYLYKDWQSIVLSEAQTLMQDTSITQKELNSKVGAIVFTDDDLESEYAQHSFSLGAIDPTGTVLYTETEGVEDVTCYVYLFINEDDETVVDSIYLIFHSTSTIYAPVDSSYLFSSSTVSNQFVNLEALLCYNLDLSYCTTVDNMLDGMTSLEEFYNPSLYIYSTDFTINFPNGNFESKDGDIDDRICYNSGDVEQTVWTISKSSFLSKNWQSKLLAAAQTAMNDEDLTQADINSIVTEIAFTYDMSKTTGFTEEELDNLLSFSVGSGSAGSGTGNEFTQADYNNDQGVDDIICYVDIMMDGGDISGLNLYFYSESTIYAPVDSSYLFSSSTVSNQFVNLEDLLCYNLDLSYCTTVNNMLTGMTSLTNIRTPGAYELAEEASLTITFPVAMYANGDSTEMNQLIITNETNSIHLQSSEWDEK